MNGTAKFGVAKDIITPAIRTSLMGFSSVFGKPFENIHDDLYARTLILQDETDETIILIALDLCFHDESLTLELRSYASEKHGVSHDNLLVIYTHTHYGPAVKGYDQIFHNPEYEDFLYDRVCRCIDRAFLNIYTGTVEYGHVDGMWNISRRKIENNKVSFSPNLEGQRDTGLYLIKLSDNDGNIKALLVNFACHPSNANQYLTVSAEYPGRLCQLLESKFYGATALFFQGCGADTKLRAGADGERFKPLSYDEINEVTTGMAQRLHGLILSGKLTPLKLSLGAYMFKIPVPIEVYPKSFFESELNKYSGGQQNIKFKPEMIKNHNSNLLNWANAEYILDNYDDLKDILPLNCGLIRLNDDFWIVTVGGEPSSDVKRVIENALDVKQLLFFGYNDAIAYIPSDKIIAEGGYEADGSVTEYRLKGRIAPGIDELFCEYFRAAAKRLTDNHNPFSQ